MRKVKPLSQTLSPEGCSCRLLALRIPPYFISTIFRFAEYSPACIE